VFPSVPTLETLQRDLTRAGISYRDAEGRQADFHSLRYTFCTFLALANVPIRTAMELMRHKDPRLTLQIYTDAGQLDLDEAVSRLPGVSSAEWQGCWERPRRGPATAGAVGVGAEPHL
jgi:integrase